jgi:hypothetical protein
MLVAGGYVQNNPPLLYPWMRILWPWLKDFPSLHRVCDLHLICSYVVLMPYFHCELFNYGLFWPYCHYWSQNKSLPVFPRCWLLDYLLCDLYFLPLLYSALGAVLLIVELPCNLSNLYFLVFTCSSVLGVCYSKPSVLFLFSGACAASLYAWWSALTTFLWNWGYNISFW